MKTFSLTSYFVRPILQIKIMFRLLLLVSVLTLGSAGNLAKVFIDQAQSNGVPLTAERFKLFSRNVGKIWELNSESEGKWTASVNKFTFMTAAEREAYKGLNATHPELQNGNSAPRSLPAGPDSVDWRELGHVTSPREQWGCGSCWAFAAVAVIETRAAQAGSAKESLSDQEIVDCASPYRDGCDGGDSLKAFEYVYEREAISKQADYPYIGRSNPSCLAKGKENGLSNVKQRYYTYRYGAEQMIAALAEGPLVIEFNAIEPFFYYKTGIFDYPKCGTQVDHAMAAVGYAPNYVLLKNSWGETWGDKGFAKVARGYNLCGMYKWGFHPNFLPATAELEEK